MQAEADPSAAVIVDYVRLSEADKKRQRTRSFALAWALFAVVMVFFVMTVVKLTGNVAHLAK